MPCVLRSAGHGNPGVHVVVWTRHARDVHREGHDETCRRARGYARFVPHVPGEDSIASYSRM